MGRKPCSGKTDIPASPRRTQRPNKATADVKVAYRCRGGHQVNTEARANKNWTNGKRLDTDTAHPRKILDEVKFSGTVGV